MDSFFTFLVVSNIKKKKTIKIKNSPRKDSTRNLIINGKRATTKPVKYSVNFISPTLLNHYIK